MRFLILLTLIFAAGTAAEQRGPGTQGTPADDDRARAHRDAQVSAAMAKRPAGERLASLEATIVDLQAQLETSRAKLAAEKKVGGNDVAHHQRTIARQEAALAKAKADRDATATEAKATKPKPAAKAGK